MGKRRVCSSRRKKSCLNKHSKSARDSWKRKKAAQMQVLAIDYRRNTDAMVIQATPSTSSTISARDSFGPITSSCGNSNHFAGRRIVTDLVGVLRSHLKAVKAHSESCEFCGELVYSKEIRVGLVSTLVYRCSKQPLCSFVHHVSTRGLLSEGSVNEDFTRGALAIGIGYSQARELMAAMNVPFMLNKLYTRCESAVGSDISHVLATSMKEAGREEIQLASERGECMDAEGYWRIPVIVDGGWGKRSYGHYYSSNSGVAVIIGRYTRKILHIGIKNKFCAVCQRAENRKEKADSHRCPRNWSSTSTGMERDIIVQGFRESEEEHKLRYTTLIGDGDSSVYTSVITGVSYGYLVQKVECANHVVKCYTKKLYAVAKDSKSIPTQEGIDSRKLLSSTNIKTLKNLARATIKRHAEAATSVTTNAVNKLRSQLKNGPYHCFGIHDNCPGEVCPIRRGESVESAAKLEKGKLLVRSGLTESR